jgi:hypothetical protein
MYVCYDRQIDMHERYIINKYRSIAHNDMTET